MATTDTLKVSIVQGSIIWHQPKENYDNFTKLINKTEDPDLIVLPEMWSTGFTMKTHLFAQEAEHACQHMQEWSKDKSCGVLGSIIVEEQGQCYNRSLLYDSGKLVAKYDKKHLFGFSGEDRNFRAGTDKCVVDFRHWKLCINICYDLRFPVWSRNYEDYDILIYSANWPDAREDAWLSLLKARAIENQSYVIGANCNGKDAWHNTYKGNSRIFSFDGQRLAHPVEGEAILSAELERNALLAFRQKFPFLNDRDPMQFI